MNAHLKTGRPQGEQDSTQPQISCGVQERRRVRPAADGATAQPTPVADTPRLVLIEWEDSYGCSANWQDLEHPKPRLMRCRSVGWLYHDGPDCKLLVPHVADGEEDAIPAQGCGDMTIPASAVRSIRELRVSAR